MRKLESLFRVILTIYFFLLANMLFWGPVIALFGTLFISPNKLDDQFSVSAATDMVISFFVMYEFVLFFRNTKEKYSFGIPLLVFILLETEIFRFFFVIHGFHPEKADLTNILFFGIPLALLIVLKRSFQSQEKQ